MGELLLKHMIRKHYTKEMNQQIGDNFANFWVQEQKKGTVKCKTCGKTLPASRAVVAHHWGIAHRKVIKIYFEEVYPKELRIKSKKKVEKVKKVEPTVPAIQTGK